MTADSNGGTITVGTTDGGGSSGSTVVGGS
jgi:hypothetical protein